MNSKKKVLYLCENLGSYHAARLREMAHGSDIVCCQTFQASQIYSWKKITCDEFQSHFIFDGDVPPRSLDRVRLVVSKLKMVFDRVKPEFVVVPGWGFFESVVAIGMSFLRGIPVVLLSDTQLNDSRRRWATETVKRILVRSCFGYFVAGSTHKSYLIGLGVDESRVALRYDVVDNSYFFNSSCNARKNDSLIRSQLNLPTRFFLIVARLVEKKNLFFAVDCFARFCEISHASNECLVIVGDGELRVLLQRRILDLALTERILLVGNVTYEDVPKYYALSIALILPSVVEQWGLVVNEAMACSVPVLVSNRAGSSFDLVIDGINGDRFDPIEQEQLVKLLLKYSRLSNFDLYSLGNKAWEHVNSKWTLEHHRSEFEGLIGASRAESKNIAVKYIFYFFCLIVSWFLCFRKAKT